MNSMSPSEPKEITLRGIILGVLITLVFTAAQVYLGLKVGLTFATSIPAAVISMALLSAFKDATIQENNIVQTIASAAGTLASVIFVLPGLLMIGWWAHVPFLPVFGACAIGGVLGVMYTMPLRRALVSQSDLPYPEGVAAAEVLKVGTASRSGAQEGKAGLLGGDLGLDRLGGVRARRGGEAARGRGLDVLPGGEGRHRHRRVELARADRRGAPDGHHRRHRDARRPGHRVGRARPDPDHPAR